MYPVLRSSHMPYAVLRSPDGHAPDSPAHNATMPAQALCSHTDTTAADSVPAHNQGSKMPSAHSCIRESYAPHS